MTHTPIPPDADIDLGGFAEPERTSILAILSLVLSLICFIPGLSLLGVAFAIISLIAISSSEGRVGGRGLAIGGLVVGLLVTTLWLGIAIGLNQVAGMMNRGMLRPAGDMMLAVEQGDADGVRRALVPSSASALTDEHVAQFRDAYAAKLGSFVDSPDGALDWIAAFSAAGSAAQNLQGSSQDLVPIPAEFDNAVAIIGVQLERTQAAGGGTIRNLGVLTPDGKWTWLIPEDALAPPQAPPPPDAPQGAPPPADEPGAAGEGGGG